MNDRDLVQRTLGGDREAYRRLVERYRNAVYGLAISYVADFDLAEDLAQEAFIRGYYRLRTLSDGERFGGWLRTIAANLCRMEIRRRRAVPVLEYGLEALVDPAPAPDEVQERDEVQQQVLEALDTLSRKDREAVTLYYLEGQGVEEVGRFLGVSGSAIKGRLHRARQKLRKEMVEMAKKTLSKRKLKPEFADRVEIRAFGDLNRLTDEELRTLVQRRPWGEGMPLVSALTVDDPETVALRKRVLGVLPQAERENLEVNLEYLDPEESARREVVVGVQKLQSEGSIRPAPQQPEPARPKGTVEIKGFSDLLRLTDREIQTVLREVYTVDLAAALVGRGSDIGKVADRMRANVSERVWKIIEIAQTHHRPTPDRARAAREEILRAVRRLQGLGTIRPWKGGPSVEDRVEVRSFEEWGKLNDREIQHTLREVDTKDLAVALKGSSEALKDRIFSNVSERVGKMLEEGMASLPASDEEVAAFRERIVETVRRLQVLGVIRPPSRRPTARQYERAVQASAQKRIEGGRHAGRWTPGRGAYRELMPFLGMVVRDEGIDAVKEAFEGIQEPVFELGARLLADGAKKEEIADRLQAVADRELKAVAQKFQMVIEGVTAIRDGEDPRAIGERMSKI